MTAKHECSEKAWNRHGYYPCQRPATVQRNGEWYCWQHDPEYIAKKVTKRRAAWEAEGDREAAKYACIARNARLGMLMTEKTAALLERLVLRILEYGIGKDDARQARTLAARIREVLALEVIE